MGSGRSGGDRESIATAPLAPRAPDGLPQVLAGRYVIGERLGRGGAGVVFAAHDAMLDRTVAIKVLAAALDGPAAEAALLREARLLARVTHPHVVAVYDAGVFDGRVWLAMQRVIGVDLRRWMAAEPALALRLRVIAGAAAGLAAIHAAGLVHGDVKPENLLVGDDLAVQLVDFGLARVAGGDGPGGGTPRYLAPEQHAGAPPSEAADRFALCVTAWELVAGRHPFEAGDLHATVEAIVRGVRGARPASAPPWLIRALERGLSEVPGERFASTVELARALAGPPRRARRWLAGGIAGAAAIAGAMLAGLGGDPTPPCELAGDDLAAWSPALRMAVIARQTTARGVAGAGDVAAALDGWIADYGAARRTACQDHRRGAVSTELYDLSSACFDDERASALRVVQRLTAGDRASLDLPGLAACRDPVLVRARAPMPAGDGARRLTAALARHREVLDEIALRRCSDAGALAAIERDVAAIGYPPATIAVLLDDGWLAGACERPADAVRALHEARRLAAAARDPKAEAQAWAGLIMIANRLVGDPRPILAQADVIEDALARLDGQPAEVTLLIELGAARAAAGQLEPATRDLERAARLAAALPGGAADRASALRELGGVRADGGDPGGARAAFDEAAALLAGDDPLVLRERGLVLFGIASLERGVAPLAELMACAEAATLFTRAGDDADRVTAETCISVAATALAGPLALTAALVDRALAAPRSWPGVDVGADRARLELAEALVVHHRAGEAAALATAVIDAWRPRAHELAAAGLAVRARARLVSGDRTGALADAGAAAVALDASAAGAPDRIELLVKLATIRFEADDLAGSERDVDAAIADASVLGAARDLRVASAYGLRAAIAQRRGDRSAADRDYAAALAATPADQPAWRTAFTASRPAR